MRCTNCGQEITADSTFCVFCGAKVQAPMPYNNNINNGGFVNPAGTYRPMPAKKQANVGMIVLCVVAAVVIISALVFAFFMFKMFYIDSVSSYETAAVPKATEAVSTPQNDYYPAPYFTMATASSIRGTDTEGGKYSVMAVLDTDNETKWVPSKSSNGGVSEWITVYSSDIQYVSGIQILNGYHKSYEIWNNNNRVKGCTITFSDGTSRKYVLDDTMSMINIDLGEVIATSSITLRIDSIYRGAKWNDTAITYIGAY